MRVTESALDVLLHRLWGPDGLALLLLWLTVLAAAGVTYVASAVADRSVTGFIRHVVPAGIWTHPSARADVLFWFSRRLAAPLFVVPGALSAASCGYAVHSVIMRIAGVGSGVSQGRANPALLYLFTLTMLLTYDFSAYITHYLQHRIPILWELHKVHHSAELMVGTTKDRVHPIEGMLEQVANSLIPGVVFGAWLFVMPHPIEATVFGINVYVFRGILMLDFVRHTHLKLSYGPFLNKIFVSPHYHQLHHSRDPRHADKNFGLVLIIWDKMFGTLFVPDRGEDFAFGLADDRAADYQSLPRLYFLPIRKIGAMLVSTTRPVGTTAPTQTRTKPVL